MENYHVVLSEKGWEIIGSIPIRTFKTQREAIEKAREYASKKKNSVIVHSKEGKVLNVISFDEKLSSGELLSANVKHRLSDKNVRNSIAEVLSERMGIK
jgi:hypothetical protein